jgi:hypothetical protein
MIKRRRARWLTLWADVYIGSGILIAAVVFISAFGFGAPHDSLRGYLVSAGGVFGIGLIVGGIYIRQCAARNVDKTPPGEPPS